MNGMKQYFRSVHSLRIKFDPIINLWMLVWIRRPWRSAMIFGERLGKNGEKKISKGTTADDINHYNLYFICVDCLAGHSRARKRKRASQPMLGWRISFGLFYCVCFSTPSSRLAFGTRHRHRNHLQMFYVYERAPVRALVCRCRIRWLCDAFEKVENVFVARCACKCGRGRMWKSFEKQNTNFTFNVNCEQDTHETGTEMNAAAPALTLTNGNKHRTATSSTETSQAKQCKISQNIYFPSHFFHALLKTEMDVCSSQNRNGKDGKRKTTNSPKIKEIK